ncbi:MAG: hypothetical protein MHM6MM_004286 [Cercozoa sp. M6MM]
MRMPAGDSVDTASLLSRANALYSARVDEELRLRERIERLEHELGALRRENAQLRDSSAQLSTSSSQITVSKAEAAVSTEGAPTESTVDTKQPKHETIELNDSENLKFAFNALALRSAVCEERLLLDETTRLCAKLGSLLKTHIGEESDETDLKNEDENGADENEALQVFASLRQELDELRNRECLECAELRILCANLRENLQLVAAENERLQLRCLELESAR